MLRQVITNSHRGPDDAVGLGVAATLVATGFEVASHLIGHQVDNVVKRLFLPGKYLFLRQSQSVVRAVAVNQILQQTGDRSRVRRFSVGLK